MPRHGEFSAFVQVDGTTAEEFNVRTTVRPDGVPEIRCAIESKTGKSFAVLWTYAPSSHSPRLDVIGSLDVDGKGMCQSSDYAWPHKPEALKHYVNNDSHWPLMFSPLRLLETEADLVQVGSGAADRFALVDNQRAKEVGTIRLDVWTAFKRPRQPHSPPRNDGDPPKQAALLEKQKKQGVFLTHSIQYGAPTHRSSRASISTHKTYRDTLCSVFVFEYASRSFLELAGHIPQPGPSPTLVITLSDDEDDSEIILARAPAKQSGESTKPLINRLRDRPTAAVTPAGKGQLCKPKRECEAGEPDERTKRRRVSDGSMPSVPSRMVVELSESESDSDDGEITLVASRAGWAG